MNANIRILLPSVFGFVLDVLGLILMDPILSLLQFPRKFSFLPSRFSSFD